MLKEADCPYNRSLLSPHQGSNKGEMRRGSSGGGGGEQPMGRMEMAYMRQGMMEGNEGGMMMPPPPPPPGVIMRPDPWAEEFMKGEMHATPLDR